VETSTHRTDPQNPAQKAAWLGSMTNGDGVHALTNKQPKAPALRHVYSLDGSVLG